VIVTATISINSGVDLSAIEEAARRLDDAGITAALLDEGGRVGAFEATTLAGYLARHTRRIGLVPANSALYGFPYHLARRLATIDHLTAGRAGWLISPDTGDHEVSAYDWRSAAHPGAEPARASEYVEIALALWNSWEEGAARPDKASGDFKDDSRIHAINHTSPAFLVRGPLDVPRSPQGRPSLFVTVTAPGMVDFAAGVADVIIVDGGSRDVQAGSVASLVEAVRTAVGRAGRSSAVRLLARITVGSGLHPTADPAALAALAGDLVDRHGVHGVDIIGDGSVAWARCLAEAAPNLVEPPRTAEGAVTLANRLGLTDRDYPESRAA
jgi:alkanesulfonate monooxygenase SsuD/methylene tetrahydromethanopterin reductase-like flavin-dependent oxidoreductase (luciferase family)